jgi:hypothetical protein
MTTKRYKLNGTDYHPSSCEYDPGELGNLITTRKGKRVWVSRGYKPNWKFSWDMIDETTRSALETLSRLGATFTLIDEFDTSYTVQCDEKAFTSKTDGEMTVTSIMYYDVTLEVHAT